MISSWNALEVLEKFAQTPGFSKRWRAFVRDCQLRIPGLPPEAQEWFAVSDAFDGGQLTHEELQVVRLRAWEFYVRVWRSGTPANGDAVKAAMNRLWPPETSEEWYADAWYFRKFCDTTGMSEHDWQELLQKHFADILENAKQSQQTTENGH